MAASLGLSTETFSYYSPFLGDYVVPNFPAIAATAAVSTGFTELDDHPFEYSAGPVFAGADHDEKMMSCEGDEKRMKVNGRIGFRTRSEVEILDDGFKWRKYGKKAVKNSPNPRNYYKCSTEGCGVKKRVERDRDDPRYVITTYDGVHNHVNPGSGGAVYTDYYSPPQLSGSPVCSASLF